MIMHRQADGTYKEIGCIMTKDGNEINKIVDRYGNVYFSGGVQKTISGYPCTLEKSKGKPVIDYKFYGNTMQDGTPSPENPVEVQSVGNPVYAVLKDSEGNILYDSDGNELRSNDILGYEIPVVCRGKNLFNQNNITVNYALNNAGSAVRTADRFMSDYIPVISGTKITISGKPDSQNNCFYSDTDEQSFISTIKLYGGTLTVPENAKYLRISGIYAQRLTAQVEYGNTATEYEPYREPVRTSIFLDEPLRKINDYVDYINFENRKIIRNIGKKMFDGSEEISRHSSFASHSSFRLPVQSIVPPKSAVLSTHAENIDFSTLYANDGYGICSHNTSTVSNLYIAIPDIKELDEMKSFLKEQHEKGTPITVYYPLTEPTEENVILPQIPMFDGTTIVEIDTEIQPSDMEITYKSR